jgi:UDP:flavonoid glycosyltransferase YjiC (YdhE family)
MVPIARALRERGHETAFLTGRRGQLTVERHGLPCFPFQHVDEDRIYAAVFSPRARSFFSRAAILNEWMLSTLPDQVRDHEEVCAAWKPDAVVCDITMWGPTVVLRETRRLPVAVCSFAPGCMIPGPGVPPWGLGLPSPRGWKSRLLCRAAGAASDLGVAGFRRDVNRIRAAYSLPPLHIPVHRFLADMPLYLVPSIPELDYDRAGLPPTVHYIGPLIWNDTKRVPRPEWMDTLRRDRPWIHVTEGTMHGGQPFLLEAAASGLSGLPLEVVMTTGGDRDPKAVNLAQAASNIRLEQWVPHTELFPHTSVVITTGGAGTILTALAAGIPLIIVPTEWDKPDNAQRVVEAGAAIRISPRSCSPRNLRLGVEKLLSTESYRTSARRLAALLNRHDGPREAAELIETIFST